jgi:hypothetical protein
MEPPATQIFQPDLKSKSIAQLFEWLEQKNITAELCIEAAILHIYKVSTAHAWDHPSKILKELMSPGISLWKIRTIWEYLLVLYELWYPEGLKDMELFYEKTAPQHYHGLAHSKCCIVCHNAHVDIYCTCGMHVWYCSKKCSDAFKLDHKDFCGPQKMQLTSRTTTRRCSAASALIDSTYDRDEYLVKDVAYIPLHLVIPRLTRLLHNLQKCNLVNLDNSHEDHENIIKFIHMCIIQLTTIDDNPTALVSLFASSKLNVLCHLYHHIFIWGRGLVHKIVAIIVYTTDISLPRLFGGNCITCFKSTQHEIKKIVWHCPGSNLCYNRISWIQKYLPQQSISINEIMKYKVAIPYHFYDIYMKFKNIGGILQMAKDPFHEYIAERILDPPCPQSFKSVLRIFISNTMNYLIYVCMHLYIDQKLHTLIRELVNAINQEEKLKFTNSVVVLSRCMVCNIDAVRHHGECGLCLNICSDRCMDKFKYIHDAHCKTWNELKQKGKSMLPYCIANRLTNSLI